VKNFGRNFHVVLFIMLYKVVLIFKSVESLVCDHSNESFIGQYFHVVLCFVQYEVVLIFTSVDKTLLSVCDHSNENY